MTENTDTTLTRLPARLKEARRDKGLSLEAVANLSGVSRSMLSQIERGESSPTISTLWNLTQALQIDFAGLLAENKQSDSIEVLKNSETPSIDNMGNSCRIRILSPPEAAGGHEVYDIRFEADGSLESHPHVQGAKEHLTVLEGSIQVTSGSATSELSQGDTARYAGDVAHSISAINGPARIFLIVKDAGT
ncbi:helix-turn-helix domain-containing protein [Curvivirga sp.]|uniref:helix-turn-helix domain-containing protein n=1 Tax=Curvivirga sp. TaxID=2856848 RepID=UPI003B5B170D